MNQSQLTGKLTREDACLLGACSLIILTTSFTVYSRMVSQYDSAMCGGRGYKYNLTEVICFSSVVRTKWKDISDVFFELTKSHILELLRTKMCIDFILYALSIEYISYRIFSATIIHFVIYIYFILTSHRHILLIYLHGIPIPLLFRGKLTYYCVSFLHVSINENSQYRIMWWSF